MFELAERLGKTVRELVTGRPAPLSNAEYEEWKAYTKAYIARQKEAQRLAKYDR